MMIFALRLKREIYAKILLVDVRLIGESNNLIILPEELVERVTLDIDICAIFLIE